MLLVYNRILFCSKSQHAFKINVSLCFLLDASHEQYHVIQNGLDLHVSDVYIGALS